MVGEGGVEVGKLSRGEEEGDCRGHDLLSWNERSVAMWNY